MKSIKYYLCIPGFFILLSATLFAQIGLNKLAQSTMNFLLVGTSSRACGLGEAYTAVGSGSESMFYNPAGMAEMSGDFDINLNYTQWIADINYLSGGISVNLYNYGVVGFSLLTVDYGDIYGTSLITSSQQDQYPLGYIDNGKIGNVSAYAFGLSYAKAISQQFLVGGNIRIAGQNLGESVVASGPKKNNASKLVFDAGVEYYTGFKSFRFGMSIRNFSSNIKRESIEEELPLQFVLGAAIDALDIFDSEHNAENTLTLAVDFLHQNNYSERVNVGAEYTVLGFLALRGGYQTNRDIASWSGGVGVRTSISDYNMAVDYSYSRFEIFNSVNRLSLSFTF
jgi:hypothetical protein